MAPDESKDPTTILVDRLMKEYDLERETAEIVVKRYFQVNPEPSGDPTRYKNWAEAEAEEIYLNRRYWD